MLSKNLKRKIKDKIKFFFFSDYIKRKYLKKKFHSNPQANWTGETLIDQVPSKIKYFFNKSNLKSYIITKNGITKNTGFIKNYAKIFCDGLDLNKDSIHFSFWAKYWSKNTILKIKINDHIHEYHNLRSDYNDTFTEDNWFDVSIKIDKKFEYLEIFCDQEEIYFAAPVTFDSIKLKKNKQAHESNHIIVLVLDGVVAEYFYDEKKKFVNNIKISQNIDNFFKNYFSTKFAFSTGEWTLPGISSFFSGMHTTSHKIFKPKGYNFYNDNLPSLPEELQKNGYKTQFYSTGNRTTPLFGFNKGFDNIHFSHPHGLTEKKFKTQNWINSLIDFLNIYQNDKTFSYVHFPNTHQDWMIPGFDNLSFSLLRDDKLGLDFSSITEKDAEIVEKLRIYEFDLQIEALFNFIKKNIDQNTTVILTGDHGSPFFKKYDTKGASNEFDDIRPILNFRRTNVPFMCRTLNNKYEVNKFDDNQLVQSSTDLSKTILDLCNIESKSFIDGVSIFDKNKRKFVISESIYNNQFELAVIKNNFSFFQKFDFDEKNFNIKNINNSIKKLFETKNSYNHNLIKENNHEEFLKIALNHIENKI